MLYFHSIGHSIRCINVMTESIGILNDDKARSLKAVAEQAQTALARFAGHQVGYDPTALQALDEWIDRHLRQFPDPSRRMRLLWTAFLGEVLRQRHGGDWALQPGGQLAVAYPRSDGDYRVVAVSAQVERRIEEGISASLAYFYAMTTIELKAEHVA